MDVDGSDGDGDDNNDEAPAAAVLAPKPGGSGILRSNTAKHGPNPSATARATARTPLPSSRPTTSGRVTKPSTKSTSKRQKKTDMKSKYMTQAEKKKILWSEIINKSGFKPTPSNPNKGLSVDDCRGQPPAGCSHKEWENQFRSADDVMRKRVADPKLATEMREGGWTRDQALALHAWNRERDARRQASVQQKGKKEKKAKSEPEADEDFEEEDTDEDEDQ